MIIPIEIADQDAQYILAAFSEGYSEQVADIDGTLIPNPVSRQDHAIAKVLEVLKVRVADYLERQAVGEAQQLVEEARLTAVAAAGKITITVAQE